jgi:hypothetical protein
MRHGQNSTGTFQPSEEKMGRQFHSVAWKPRFIARTATDGVWFTCIIPPCPLKRRLEQNESVRVHVSLRPVQPYSGIVSYIRHVENRRRRV